LELLWENPDKKECGIRVHCSKGTYIRSLCHDIGQKLGCGAAMKELVRTRVGRFDIAEAMTLSEVEAACEKQQISQCLIPVDAMFEQYRKCFAGEEAMRFLKNGNFIAPSLCCMESGEPMDWKDLENGEQFRVYGAEKDFYAIYRYEKKDSMLHIVKMFHE
jgi:tRNA pseudouridine55 synthase